MSTTSLPTVAKGPAPADGRESGGPAYVVQPLTLPLPSTTDADVECEMPGLSSRHVLENACRRLFLISEMHHGHVEKAMRCPEEPGSGLFWFRWITGHQVSFILWQMLARASARVKQNGEPLSSSLQAITHYVRGYCAMLLYTGSCSREIYETLIRPSMSLHHRAFSGSWALDFAPVRDLFHGRPPPWAEGPDAAELRQAVKLSHLIHNGVAAKLVPNGRSLLQQSGFANRETMKDTKLLGAIYDEYFLTRRAPVLFADVLVQLLQRLNSIVQDVAVNGIHALGPLSREEEPDDLRTPEVIKLHEDFLKTSFRVARFATGSLTPGRNWSAMGEP